MQLIPSGVEELLSGALPELLSHRFMGNNKLAVVVSHDVSGCLVIQK